MPTKYPDFSNTATNCVLVLSIFTMMIASLVGLMRLLDLMWAGHASKFLVAACIYFACISLISQIKKIRLDALALILFLCLPLGISVGIINQNILNFRYSIPHITSAFFFFLMYTLGYTTTWNLVWVSKKWHKSANWILTAYTITIFLFWLIQFVFQKQLYFGIGTSDLVFPFAYFLVTGNKKLAILTILVVLFSGKRGSFLSLFSSLSFFISLPFAKRLFSRIGILTLLIFAFILTENIIEPNINSLELPPLIEGLKDRIFSVNIFRDDFNFDIATSGRSQELYISFEDFCKENSNWLFGRGYGWKYFYDAAIPGSETTDFWAHYIHLSPVNLLYLYGLPIASFIIILLLKNVAHAFRISFKPGCPRIFKVMVLYWIGSFVSSLSGYSFPSDALFWIINGALGSFSNRYEKGNLLFAA